MLRIVDAETAEEFGETTSGEQLKTVIEHLDLFGKKDGESVLLYSEGELGHVLSNVKGLGDILLALEQAKLTLLTGALE